ncbi:Na+/H+ antiporter [Acetobacter nitrogenifigens DSM 23921 = NBRC 105050]|uniref:Sodium/hydrogen exchanger family protein n=1 Tax=Acetobacter nitrogenifigens DSM 23921 = NBRC 105050 TaxID=1120919 RepID=A0A511X6B9_9PROT|nr:cation:proton antiporter [Acetobacter nitrogenifigens]GBQ92548.1 Na+/H+ antiporter [Acetobacter nitrogenifigens DSM 23921 = NBRC 105050]GEN58493.1 sodium/hydrogen exchanger family protein [Acetobacter nitrogenifigens DSM 23921 = NBRC 105050]
MTNITALISDAALFVLLPWALWRLLQKTLPIAVLPILVGILLAVWHVPVQKYGVPSLYGNDIGWVAVLVLAFTAGLEMWQHPGEGDGSHALPSPSLRRLLGGAAVALGGPFLIGSILAYEFFLPLHGWRAPHATPGIAAAAIGLCIAVSALPVLIGVVRELEPAQRPLGQLALKLAVVDDAALWIGLAALQFAAKGTAALHGWTGLEFVAVGLLVGLATAGNWASRHYRNPPSWVIWATVPVYLAAGSWAGMQLGLHELIGAYFAGAIMPPSWVRRLPVEWVGTFSLFWLAPMFFGHSGLRIDGDALTWPSVIASLMLVAVSIVTKIAAVYVYPPAAGLSRRQALSIGALLQCKGLMEIVAATILHGQGMLSEFAFASLMVLAVISTTLTGPLFRLFAPGGRKVRSSDTTGGGMLAPSTQTTR